MGLPGLIALCGSVIVGTIGVGGAVNLKKTEEVNKKVEQIETIEKMPSTAYNNYGVVNNYETTNNYYKDKKDDDTNTKQLKEIQKQLKEIQEKEPVIVEKEIIKEVIIEKENESKKDASESERKQNQLEINDGICTPSTILRCEVCEKTGTELKVWYDSNNVKHYTCTTRCTEALGVLYGE